MKGYDWYVVLEHDVDGQGRLVPSVRVAGLPEAGELALVEPLVAAVYAVTGTRKPQALPLVFEWLSKDRPAAMTVRVVYEDALTVAARQAPAPARTPSYGGSMHHSGVVWFGSETERDAWVNDSPPGVRFPIAPIQVDPEIRQRAEAALAAGALG